MTDLTTLQAVKRQLANSTGTMGDIDNDLIEQYVTDASVAFESACRRTIAGAVGTLTFDACYPTIEGRTLYVGQDLLGVIQITNGTNGAAGTGTLATDEYRMLPLNVSPKYGIQLLQGLTWQTGTDGYIENAIQVIGTFGMFTSDNIPSDITLAATKLAAWLYQTRDDNEGVIHTANGDTILPPDVPKIVVTTIEYYKRRETYS